MTDENWHSGTIYWIDLETTGLDPEKESILEIALGRARFDDPVSVEIIYDETLTLPFPSMLLDERVIDMHTKSGLLERCQTSKRAVIDAERELCSLIPKHDKPHILAGSSVHFDLGFIRRRLSSLASRFSHRLFDVSSMKLMCQSMGMPELEKNERHRAKDNLLETIDHLRRTRRWLSSM